MARFLPLSAIGLVLTCTAVRAGAMSPAEVYAKVSPSVWKVLTYDVDGLPLSQGSAVVVGEESLVTNCHVLAKSKRVAVRREKTTLDAKLELWDVQRDVCQLKAVGLNAPVVPLVSSEKVTVGQNVFAIGNPKGLDLTMSAGLVSSVRRNAADQIMLIQTSAAISGGSSGGGLFDERGQLVGLTTLGSVGDAQNLNFAVPADWVLDLPQRHAKLNKPTVTAAASAPAAAASEAATASAAMVPAGTNYASVTDVDKLPYGNDSMRARYRFFLAQPLPRAFVISDGGGWRQSVGAKSPQGDSSPPAQRALRACEKAQVGNCFLYAVDNQVVYRPNNITTPNPEGR